LAPSDPIVVGARSLVAAIRAEGCVATRQRRPDALGGLRIAGDVGNGSVKAASITALRLAAWFDAGCNDGDPPDPGRGLTLSEALPSHHAGCPNGPA